MVMSTYKVSLFAGDLRVFKYTISACTLNSYMRAIATVCAGQAALFSCWTKPSEGSGTAFKHDLKDNRNLATVNSHFGMK